MQKEVRAAGGANRLARGVSDEIMEYNQIIADKIAFLCRENQMTISQLASVGNMNRATIENIMSGKCRKPRIQTIYKISGAFHMSVREFLDFPGNTAQDGGLPAPAPHMPDPAQPDGRGG